MNDSIVRNEDGLYEIDAPISSKALVSAACEVLSEQCRREDSICKPQESKQFLMLQIGMEEREVFGVIFLDNQHRVIMFEKLFLGTINAASVYPREVVKRCLELNAAAVIFGHNHPSGVPEPSQADRNITDTLKQALALVEVRVLDHVVVGGSGCVSFAERGLI